MSLRLVPQFCQALEPRLSLSLAIYQLQDMGVPRISFGQVDSADAYSKVKSVVQQTNGHAWYHIFVFEVLREHRHRIGASCPSIRLDNPSDCSSSFICRRTLISSVSRCFDVRWSSWRMRA